MTAFYDWIATPFGWLLGLFYDFSDNYLVSILVITVIIKLLLLPSAIKQQKNSAKQMRLQAKINKIRAKYAGQGREAQMKISEETQELYRREGFNASTAGCLPMAIQLFVMMGLYGAIYSPLSKVLRLSSEVIANLKTAYNALPIDDLDPKNTRVELQLLHKFSEMHDGLDPAIVTEEVHQKIESLIKGLTFWKIDLTQTPSDSFKAEGMNLLILVPILAGVTALLSSVFMYIRQRKTNPEMAKNPAMGCMTFFSPLISVVFAFTLPAGIGFYWIISNILSFIQTVGLAAAFKPEAVIAEQMIDETVQRRSREQSVKIRKALLEAHNEKKNG